MKKLKIEEWFDYVMGGIIALHITVHITVLIHALLSLIEGR
jgi:hypothetical protein